MWFLVVYNLCVGDVMKLNSGVLIEILYGHSGLSYKLNNLRVFCNT